MTRAMMVAVLRLAVVAVWLGPGAGCGRVTVKVTDAGPQAMQPDLRVPVPPDAGGGQDQNQDAAEEANQDALPFEVDAPPGLLVPPATWTENWFDHNQVLDLVAYNDDVALYFDKDVNRAGTEWILPFFTSAWRYTQNTYGDFKIGAGDGRYYAIFHQGKHAGCHVAYYNNPAFENRNGGDCGAGPWAMPNLTTPLVDVLYPTMGGIVEYTTNHVVQSVARDLWAAQFAILFTYDLLLALDRPSDAKMIYDRHMTEFSSTPRDPTYWFRDWFYPLWRDHGHAQVMAKFLKLVAQFFVAHGGQTQRQAMTVAEMVHFMSGAAGTNLKARAVTAFGAAAVTDPALAKARLDFPQISY